MQLAYTCPPEACSQSTAHRSAVLCASNRATQNTLESNLQVRKQQSLYFSSLPSSPREAHRSACLLSSERPARTSPLPAAAGPTDGVAAPPIFSLNMLLTALSLDLVAYERRTEAVATALQRLLRWFLVRFAVLQVGGERGGEWWTPPALRHGGTAQRN